MPAELDLERLVEVLGRHGVAYVMIGGMAAVTHGSPFPTEDVDITPAPAPDNLERLSAALRELDARIRVEAVAEVFIALDDALEAVTAPRLKSRDGT